jgi:4-amino-4-deoxy-L-arabinose transferase-like glycosyltransferase
MGNQNAHRQFLRAVPQLAAACLPAAVLERSHHGARPGDAVDRADDLAPDRRALRRRRVDEAQYWAWAQSLDWGYYSKPPAIAAIISLSTAWLGDGILGVKALAMLCYPLTAWVLYRWVGEVVADISGPGRTQPARAGRLAALLFIASPVAGLLGLAATTDAPLLLAWALASYALWRAWRDSRRADWLLLGLWVGLGLMSKYTMAAFVIRRSACWRPRRRAAGWSAAGAGLALAVPSLQPRGAQLAWNAATASRRCATRPRSLSVLRRCR